MNETTKTIALWGPLEKSWCQGRGIDIGCGPDPLPWATDRFDQEDGDANHITKYVSGFFSFVYSAHCLEHMQDPRESLFEWWSLVKPGGHMIIIVPDEDLYEQGVWPSRFNEDHKHTFTLGKRESWSPVSVNLLDLITKLPNSRLIKAEIQDKGFNRQKQRYGAVSDSLLTKIIGKLGHKKILPTTFANKAVRRLRHQLDQTLHNGALAQIMTVAQRIDPSST